MCGAGMRLATTIIPERRRDCKSSLDEPDSAAIPLMVSSFVFIPARACWQGEKSGIVDHDVYKIHVSCIFSYGVACSIDDYCHNHQYKAGSVGGGRKKLSRGCVMAFCGPGDLAAAMVCAGAGAGRSSRRNDAQLRRLESLAQLAVGIVIVRGDDDFHMAPGLRAPRRTEWLRPRSHSPRNRGSAG